MSMILVVLLVVLLPPLQTAAAQTTSTMQPDVDRLVQAAEKLAGTWPSQTPPAVPEVAIVARHGKALVLPLMVLLSDDPDAEHDPRRWKGLQQAALALSVVAPIRSRACAREPVEWPPLGVGDRQDEHVPLVLFERDHEGNRWMVALRISGPAARGRGHAG